MPWQSSFAQEPVGAGEELDRMEGFLGRRGLAVERRHALEDMRGGERAFRGDESLVVFCRLARDRLSHLERHVEIFLEHAPGAAMPGAALDDGEIRLRQEAQHLRRLGTHVLRARMAGEMQADTAGKL